MARYSSFLGRRVEVQYRASDTLLPASGIFVADSGRSIFLEQSFEQRGQHRHFRWEIPYQCLVRIALIHIEDDEAPTLSEAAGRPQDSANAEEAPAHKDSGSGNALTSERLAARAAAGAGMSSVILPFRKRTHTA
jgi:hypothetical protein